MTHMSASAYRAHMTRARPQVPPVDHSARTQVYTGRLALRMLHLIRLGAPGTPIGPMLERAHIRVNGDLELTWIASAPQPPRSGALPR